MDLLTFSKKYADFIEADNRKFRTHAPVTDKTLKFKLETLLPEEMVRGRSFLDLGSYLGIAGAWVLDHGAKNYTGIEFQETAASASENLLRKWGDNVEIKEADISTYLQTLDSGSFDAVIMMGVLHSFLDPVSLLIEVGRVAKEFIFIEVSRPKIIREGKCSPDASILGLTGSAMLNIAEENSSVEGFSCVPSFPVIAKVLQHWGYTTSCIEVKDQPCQDLLSYTINSNEPLLPLRYFAIARKKTSDVLGAKPTVLQDNLKSKTKKIIWSDAAKSPDFKKWEFNAEVATNFFHIARANIPDYNAVIDGSIAAIKIAGIKPDEKIIDVGSATGETLWRLYSQGYRNLVGVDSSEQMLEKSFGKQTTGIELVCSEHLPVERGPYKVVLANWTLHFVKSRREYLESIYQALADNGIFILTEKIKYQTDIAEMLYHDFKRKSGLSEAEIKKKAEQIKNILEPFPLSWYLQTLTEIGFAKVDIMTARYNFVSFLIQK